MIRVVFFIVMALGLAGFGTVAYIATRPAHVEASAVPPPPAKVAVLTAAHPINAGTLLKPEDFAATMMAADQVKVDRFTLDTPDIRRNLVGSMTRRALAAGDAVNENDVIKPGEHGFLAAALQPGMRAVTISVDTGAGAGDLIGPGDRVDVILTQTLADQNLPAARRVAAETVLSDVRVLAIDQKLVLGAANTQSVPGNRTVTLEVTEIQAQRVSVASQLGHLSLSIRSAGPQQTASAAPDAANPGQAPGTPAGSAPGGAPGAIQALAKAANAVAGKGAAHRDPGTVWAVDVSPALGMTEAPPAAASSSMRVFQGAADVKEFKF
jgi:pilus assembly protein CpaB